MIKGKNSMEDKEQQLMKVLNKYADKDIIVAFSGGVDSTLLLTAVCKLATEKGCTVYAVTMKTTLHPSYELSQAEIIAKRTGAIFLSMEVNEFSEADIENNPIDRCYRCKKSLFQKIRDKADEYGIEIIMDGTNTDDLLTYRPGIKALKELEVKSPLVEAGFAKKDVRELAAKYYLEAATKPAAPCLATRFPYNTQLTEKRLENVERGETILKKFGFYNLRLRVHENIVRIEVDENEFEKVLAYRKEIVDDLKTLGYDYVTLDLEGFRSGSMDIHIKE